MMKTKETITIKLNKPENLNLWDLINPDLPHFIQVRKDNGGHNFKTTTGKYLRKQIPALYYFIHVLIERQHSKINARRCRYNKDFVQMFSRDIEPFKSKNDFKFIWSILERMNIIYCLDDTEPNQYKKSAKAYYFGFTEKYVDAKVVEHEIMVEKKIADKMFKKAEKSIVKKDITKSNLLNGHMLYQYQLIEIIKFDADAARLHVENLLNNNAINVKRYNTCMISINNIINGRITFSISSKCDRVYTNVTSMPKEIRQFIKDIDGKSLVELDFASFNAFVVYKIINAFVPEFKSNAEKIAYETEVDLYRRILSGGDFYTDFKEIFFPDEQLNRDQIKDVVLKYWFNARLTSRNKYRKVMLNRMPRISGIIDSMKTPNYKDFSNFAMIMENELVNNIIYKKFNEINPDAIMYTIFDSIMVEQKYATQLQSFMTEEGSKYFNLNCIVKNK